MFLDPQLRALRDDDTPQRAAQQAVYRAIAQWRESSGSAVLDAELAGFAEGGALSDFPLLAALFEAGNPSARQMAEGLIAAVATALQQSPLAQVPLRHFTDGTMSTLLIGRSGPVSLALSALDGTAFARHPLAEAVSYPPNECWEQVLAGSAVAELVDWSLGEGGQVTFDRQPAVLHPGCVFARDSQRRAVRLLRVDGCLVSLRLQRRRERGEVTREYSLADGTLLHQAAGNPRDSRFELAAALLGRMGRHDAAPLLEAMAMENATAGLRWQVLRECLAMDTATGFRALTAIARSSDDPLAVPAGALRAQLIELHPVLAEFEPCPA